MLRKLFESANQPLKLTNWVGGRSDAPTFDGPIPHTCLDPTSTSKSYLYVVTDSFGIFGTNKKGNPITCSAELTPMVES